MAGISPRSAGAGPYGPMAEAAALDLVTARIRAELRCEQVHGNPLKSAYHAVARRLGLSARRVRAYHHGEVPAAGVTAAELIAADAAWRQRIAEVRARLSLLEELSADEVADAAGRAGALASEDLDAARGAGRGPGRGLAPAADPLAGLVR